MYETEISRGMDLLDGYVPGWYNQIDEKDLDMDSCSRCILGQLYGAFGEGLNALRILEADYYGFNLPIDNLMDDTWEYEMDRLAAEWREAINNRRGMERLLAGGVETAEYEQVLN